MFVLWWHVNAMSVLLKSKDALVHLRRRGEGGAGRPGLETEAKAQKHAASNPEGGVRGTRPRKQRRTALTCLKFRGYGKSYPALPAPNELGIGTRCVLQAVRVSSNA